MKVIIVDDDEKLLSLLSEFLSERGVDVSAAASGKEALAMIEKEHFEVAILDVMMPQMDGLEVLKVLNSKYGGLPVIMLTARGEETDRVVGLELGADDYMTKPFSPRELLARIKAVMRRHSKAGIDEVAETPPKEVLNLDLQKREASFHGKPLELTSVEFEVLSILVKNKGIVLSREKILDLARGQDFIAFDRSIDVHISHIRQKLEDDPKNPTLIKTIWGIGYIFTGC